MKEYEDYCPAIMKMQKPQKPKKSYKELDKKRKPDYAEQRKTKRNWDE